MTLLKKKAVEMIERIPDENMSYVINILQNLEAMSVSKTADMERAAAGLQNILKMEKRLPEDFDPDRELREAREEKYGNFS